MVLTSSRILSCEVWLILMRKTSAPASNRRRIIALSEDAGPSVARILIRRRRLMVWFRALRLVADQADPERSRAANWACPERCPDRLIPGYPAPAAQVVRWIRSTARSRRAVRRYRPRRSRCGRSPAPDNFPYP